MGYCINSRVTSTKMLSESIALNISKRVQSRLYSSSVFRQAGSRIYVNILNQAFDKRPAKNLDGEVCFLKLVPYPMLVPVHTNVIVYLQHPGALLILQQNIDKLLQQL